MKHSTAVLANSTPLWTWPVERRHYDCTPSLSKQEMIALELWISREEREHGGGVPQHVRATLHRLIRPLSDVLNVTGASGSVGRGTVRFMLYWMLHRQTAFWAWSSEEWIELLAAKARQTQESPFQDLYQVANSCRQHAIAIAYASV